MKKVLLALAFALSISACTTKTTHLSVVVPQDTTFDVSALNRAVVRKRVSGTDTNAVFLFFPIGFPDFNEALEDALSNGGGDVMTNAFVTDELRWFVLFGYNRIIITGDVVNTSR